MHLDNIAQLIEKLREEIHKLFEKGGSISKEILKKSHELDEILNKYNEMLKKN